MYRKMFYLFGITMMLLGFTWQPDTNVARGADQTLGTEATNNSTVDQANPTTTHVKGYVSRLVEILVWAWVHLKALTS